MISVSVKPEKTTDNKNKKMNSDKPNVLILSLLASIDQSKIPVSFLCVKPVYMCHAVETPGVSNSVNNFNQLISTLSTRNLSMVNHFYSLFYNFLSFILNLTKKYLFLLFQVLNCEDSITEIPIIGILQPLTSVSVTLTFVKQDMTFTLEKMMSFQPIKQESEIDVKKSMETFVKTSVKHVLGKNCSKKKTKGTENCDKLKTEKFTSAVVDRFYQPGVKGHSQEQIISCINNRYSLGKNFMILE